MAVVSIDYIINEMHENSLNCWNVKDGKSLVAEQDDQDKDVTTAASMLKDKLQNIGNGYMTVNLSGVCKKNRKAAETTKVRTYTVITGEATKAAVAVNGIESKELSELREANKKLEMQLIESRYQQKLDDLNKKIEGLQNDEENPIGRLETILIPIITEIFTGNMARSTTSVAPVINGIEENSLVDKWLEVDPEANKVLEKIVGLAINNPSMYQQYKPILLSL
jgi:hypothetical protein